jgi:hypothetical protein
MATAASSPTLSLATPRHRVPFERVGNDSALCFALLRKTGHSL